MSKHPNFIPERNTMRLFHFPSIDWLLPLTAAAVLTGCASMGTSGETQSSGHIRILSEPAGAIAYADGTELGATPVEIVPGNVFRSGFVGFSYRYFGKLTIKKAGCETWSTEVNDNILSKDVHAKLKCDPNFQPAMSSRPRDAAAASVPGAPSNDPTIERLERIETLHKKGLISDDEYKQLRARIIEKL
jgi:hypothetical protein